MTPAGTLKEAIVSHCALVSAADGAQQRRQIEAAQARGGHPINDSGEVLRRISRRRE